ncbi:MAG: signal peptidase I [Thermoanaerobaculia bacterium]
MSSPKSWTREVLEALLVALVFAVFARTWVVQAFQIPTGSMEDNLLVGDHILVNKFVYGPTLYALEDVLLPIRPVRRGDVVVFKFPEAPRRDFIKRCVARGGDRVEVADKLLHLNGRPVEEPYVQLIDPTTYPESPFVPDHYQDRDQFGPFRVPPGHLFCLGDNRDNSHDSRFWGPVDRRLVKGRALLIYWSVAAGEPEGPRPVEPPLRWWRLPRRLLSSVASAARWDRTFQPVY